MSFLSTSNEGRNALRCVVLCALSFLALGAQGIRAQESQSRSNILQEVDIFSDGDGILLPVQVNGKEYLFALDTGSTFVVFDETIRAELPLTPRSVPITGLNEPMTVSLHDPPRDFSIGNRRVNSTLGVVCLQLSAIREGSGYDICGLVGMGALVDRVLRLDFDRGKLLFLTSATGASGERIVLGCGSGTPRVVARSVLGTQSWTIDTGYVYLHSASVSTVDFLLLCQDDRDARLSASLGFGPKGMVRARNAWFGTVALGGFRVSEVITSEHLHSFHNVLGLGFWSRFNITFDFPRSVMYLEKNRNFDRPDRVDLSGMRLIRRNGAVLVGAVEEGGPAAIAGLRVGDNVLLIRGENASKMRLFSVRELCSTPSERIAMTITRDDSRSDIELVLPDGPRHVDEVGQQATVKEQRRFDTRH